METHRVRQEAVYPFHDTRETDERYPEKTLPVIHEQLAKAAVRLVRSCIGPWGNRKANSARGPGVITFQPGGQNGWHSHPGPVFISVVSGTMTFYESTDPSCTPIVRSAGQGYLDAGNHAHIARNETAVPAMNVVTYLAPAGAPLRIDKPSPGNCPF